MLALFATLCVGVAYAQDSISFTLNVSDAKAVKVQTMNGWDWTDLTIVDGKNQITATYDEEYGEYNAFQVVANSGYLVDSITFSPETAQQWEDQRNWGSDYGFALSPTSYLQCAVYTCKRAYSFNDSFLHLQKTFAHPSRKEIILKTNA